MNCEAIREHLEAYALGALDADKQALVEQHLTECADCRALADGYSETVSRLPEALADTSPLRLPSTLKTRLMDRIDSAQTVEKPVQETPAGTKRLPGLYRRFQPFGSAAAFVLLIISIVWIARLNTALAYEQDRRESLEAQTELIFEVIDSDQTTRRFLRATENAPSLPDAAPPYGKVFTRADLPYVVSMIGRLPAPPIGQVYNLWLFSDDQHELAGTMLPDAAGFGALLYEADENGPRYDSAQLILQNADSRTADGVAVLTWNLNGES